MLRWKLEGAPAMTLRIDDPETDRLANELASLTGETPAQAVRTALAQRLERERRQREGKRLAERLNEIAKHCASLPDYDTRSPDDIIGYDEYGAPR
jgi:antitoxin VapB